MLLLPIVFFVLLGVGICTKDVNWGQVGWFLFLVLAAKVATAAFAVTPYPFFAATGVLDVVLVLMIFQGDVEIR